MPRCLDIPYSLPTMRLFARNRVGDFPRESEKPRQGVKTATFENAHGKRACMPSSHRGFCRIGTAPAKAALIEMSYTDAGSNVISFFRYTYDKAGNRLTMVDTEGVTQYQYDALDRLVQANYPDATFEAFEYDAVGNRTKLTDQDGVTDYTYDIADRMLTAGAASYTWDANGSMLTKADAAGTTQYAWTGRKQLARILFDDGTQSQYVYLPNSNLRFSATDKAVITGNRKAAFKFAFCSGNAVSEFLRFPDNLGIDENFWLRLDIFSCGKNS